MRKTEGAVAGARGDGADGCRREETLKVSVGGGGLTAGADGNHERLTRTSLEAAQQGGEVKGKEHEHEHEQENTHRHSSVAWWRIVVRYLHLEELNS